MVAVVVEAPPPQAASISTSTTQRVFTARHLHSVSIEGPPKLVGDVLVECDQPDLRDQARATIEPLSGCLDDHLACFRPRVSEYAGRNGRHRNGPASAQGCCVQGCRHRFLQQTLVVLSLPVARADNVDHDTRAGSWPAEVMAARPGPIGPCSATQSSDSFWIDRAARLHDRSGHTAAVLKVFVGSVDDRRYRLGRQIPLDDFDHRENSTDRRGSLCSGMRRGVMVLALAAVLLPAAPAMAAVTGRGDRSWWRLWPGGRLRDLMTSDDDSARPASRGRRRCQPSSPTSSNPAAPRRRCPLSPRGAGTFGIRPRFARPTSGGLRSDRGIPGFAVSAVPPHRPRRGSSPARSRHSAPRSMKRSSPISTRQWGWAGLGLAAAALTLVALWALPDRRRRAQAAEESEREAGKRTRPCRRPRRRSRIPQPPLTPPTTEPALGLNPVCRDVMGSWHGLVAPKSESGGLQGRGLHVIL